MCLLLAAFRLHPRHDLAVAANRDEFHARPTQPLHPWAGSAGVIAGRDLTAGGTWLGIDARGRFAAVTNFHDGPAPRPGQPSRGRLVADFLQGTRGAAEYLRKLEPGAADYAGFNLLVADTDTLWYASNRAPRFARQLQPGLYALSNHLLDTPWPKAERARRGLAAWVNGGGSDATPLRAVLTDTVAEPAGGLAWPAASGPFISGADYGTRSSTWLTRAPQGLRVAEENFAPLGRSLGVTQFSVGPG
jgi:uncharacterized protein with NRDE domain